MAEKTLKSVKSSAAFQKIIGKFTHQRKPEPHFWPNIALRKKIIGLKHKNPLKLLRPMDR
jgi:hypothetical protein